MRICTYAQWKATKDSYYSTLKHYHDDHPLAARTLAGLSQETTRTQWCELYSAERKKARLREWPQTRAGKDWFSATSICPRCSKEISNRAYWGEGRKGSAHLKGTCKPDTFFPVKIPRQSWKSKYTPTLPPVTYAFYYGDYRGYRVQGHTIDNLADLCKFWGVNNIGGTIALPKPKTKRMKRAA